MTKLTMFGQTTALAIAMGCIDQTPSTMTAKTVGAGQQQATKRPS